MIRADQLVFGYRDGHQLLAGSRQLDPHDLRLLLGATDMSIDRTAGRYVTGLRLTTQPDYALCATWPAPRPIRPGAVVAHVLLIPTDVLRHVRDPIQLLRFLNQPDDVLTHQYSLPMNISEATETPDLPRRSVLERTVQAAFGTQSVVVEPDLGEAELAIGAVWRMQWPALRASFTFRTRPTSKLDKPGADVVVARQVRGAASPRRDDQVPTWVTIIVESISEPGSSAFPAFLAEFGPREAPEPNSVRILSELFVRLANESVDSVREFIELNYPAPSAAVTLKQALFGPGSARPWSGGESERVSSLLRSPMPAWDVSSLELVSRLERLISTQGVSILGNLSKSAPTSTIDAVMEALRRKAGPRDLRTLLAVQSELACRLASDNRDLMEDGDLWSDLPLPQARLLLGLSEVTAGALVTAIRAGFGEVVVETNGPLRVATAILSNGAFRDARATLMDVVPENLSGGSVSYLDRLVLLRVALWGAAQIEPNLPVTLERQRDDVDEFWLRAAVAAVACDQLSSSEVLESAFGPLHNAITSDQLPHECWAILDPVLPIAGDPALRLRRYLIAVAETNQWTGEQFGRALRDAGPHAEQLLHELSGGEGRDDWWVAAARSVGRTALSLLRFHR